MTTDPRSFFILYALENAVRHQNVPKAGSVLGALLGAHPEFRTKAKELTGILAEVLAEVEALTPEEREARLREEAPEMLAKKEKKEKKTGLAPLDHVPEGGVVVRFAPNPSGPLHLGHARAAYLNDYYVREYGGRYVIRIEDTDPKRIEPENYGLLMEDLDWLGLTNTEYFYQSDRLDLYYAYGRKLIELGGAYLCTCDSETFRELKNSKKPCPCRNHSVEENVALWEQMFNGTFAEGTIVVRVKTEIDHPDPAMRDFAIFRIVESPPHPRVEATIYPMMNFSVAVDDHLLGMTHVIRGKDHIANAKRQRYIYEYFGWTEPAFFHYGRMSVGDVVLSTSAMKAGIAEGTYSGWDDIHLGTLKAIARRGIQAEAVRKAMVLIGMGQTDIVFSWENLFAANKELVDPVAHRYFFVPDPVTCMITGAEPTTAIIPKHPNDASAGMRELFFEGKVCVARSDLEGVTMVRLKDLFNVSVEKTEDGKFSLTYAGDSLDEVRAAKGRIIQWLPDEETISCTLLRPDGDMQGVCEPAVALEEDRVIQFERIGFARIDAVDKKHGVTAYFAHR